jgi:hypothetical protein
MKMNFGMMSDVFFEVTFDKGLKLYYELFDNDLTHRWIELVKACNNNDDYKIRSNFLKIFSQKEIEIEFENMCDDIALINSVSDRQLPIIESLEYLLLNKHLLNDLHEEFEIYGDNKNPLINKQMRSLNDRIHNFETILKQKNDANKTCFSVVSYDENSKDIFKLEKTLKYEDYFLLAPDFKWGYIYLGYNTLGKSWNTIANDNDIEVVLRNQVRPQKKFSSEMYINFFENIPHFRKQFFYNWWTKNDFSKLYENKFTIEDFAFGSAPLARIIYYTTDNNETLYEADPWSVINTPEAKFEWNKNIWSKQNSIIKTQFVKAFTNV